MEAISYHLVRAVQNDDLNSVADAMTRGANPNGRYAGTYPLHMAVEKGKVDLAAFLVHWGAKPIDTVDSSGRSALFLAKDIAKKKKGVKAQKDDPMVKLLTDEEELKRVVADLKARMEEEHQRIRALRRESLPKQFAFFFFLFIVTIAGLHALIIYAPDTAERVLPPRMLSDIQLLSPILEHPAHAEFKRQLAAQQAMGESPTHEMVGEPSLKEEL